MFVVETNILVYAADCDAPEHEKCRSLLQAWREQSSPWYLTWGIIYEFLRVASHPSVCRTPLSGRDAWAFVQAVLAAIRSKESAGQPAPADAAAPGRQPSTVCPVAAPARTCYS